MKTKLKLISMQYIWIFLVHFNLSYHTFLCALQCYWMLFFFLIYLFFFLVELELMWARSRRSRLTTMKTCTCQLTNKSCINPLLSFEHIWILWFQTFLASQQYNITCNPTFVYQKIEQTSYHAWYCWKYALETIIIILLSYFIFTVNVYIPW
jgi:hypothetical protein